MTILHQLFQPLTIGRMRVANRIMLPGMSAGMSVMKPAQMQMIADLVERARHAPGSMPVARIGLRLIARSPT